jgi:hypothetical protein
MLVAAMVIDMRTLKHLTNGGKAANKVDVLRLIHLASDGCGERYGLMTENQKKKRRKRKKKEKKERRGSFPQERHGSGRVLYRRAIIAIPG